MDIISIIDDAKTISLDRGFIYWNEKIYLGPNDLILLRRPKDPEVAPLPDYNLHRIKNGNCIWTANGSYLSDADSCIALLNLSGPFIVDYGGFKYEINLENGHFYNGYWATK